jgi:hypothetical protein
MRKLIVALVFCSAFLAGNNVQRLFEASGSHTGLADAAEDTVLFNMKTRIYHGPGCSAGKACTVNCVSMARSEAAKRGRPCGRCGGI